MNQVTASRAVAELVQRGERDGFLVHFGGAIMFVNISLFVEDLMAIILDELENQALRLSPKDRGELIHRLIVSLDGEPEESPEVIAKAWDEEISRRVDDMEAGRTQWIPADEVMIRLRTKINAAKAVAGQS